MAGDRDTELEAALRALGTRLHVPPPPAVTDAVLARLDRPRTTRRLVTAAVATLLAISITVTTAMVVSPAVRAAVFDLLRIGAVELHENQPAPVVPTLDAPLPGERDVTLADATAAADFPLRLPTGLGPPGAVRTAEGAHVVMMAFGGVRIDQFDGGLDPMFTKFTSATDIHHVKVGDRPAVWVDRPHPVFYTGNDGRMHEASARVAGSTLIWERDGITYRVEGDLTQRRAIEIAESLR